MVGIRSIAVSIFLLALVAFASLSPQDPFNSQVTTRLGLALSLLDGSVSIDRYAGRTIDKAEVAGHYYADKVPGHSLLALPATALTRAVVAGPDTDEGVFRRLAQLVTIGTNGVLSALAAACLFLAAIRLGSGVPGAVFGSLTLALGTPFLGWSTAFFAHSITGSLLIIAFATGVAGVVSATSLLSRRPVILGLLLGAILGFTLVVDLTAAPLVAAGGLLALVLLVRQDPSVWANFVPALVAGGALGLAPLPLYNLLAFGSPFTLGYSSVVGFEGMRQGLFGVTAPSPVALFELLFGLYRGLLPLSPILLLVPLGLLRMAQRQETRTAAGAVVFAALAYLLINASYHYWNGGWSTGPRHLVPMLPFLGLALCFAMPVGKPQQAVAGILLLLSLALSLVCALGGMFVPEDYRNPVLEWVLPRAIAPDNLGRALPVLATWAGFAALWVYAGRRWPERGVEAVPFPTRALSTGAVPPL